MSEIEDRIAALADDFAGYGRTNLTSWHAAARVRALLAAHPVQVTTAEELDEMTEREYLVTLLTDLGAPPARIAIELERFDAAHPVQDEVTFETTLLDPVWLTTSSGRCTTRPVPTPVTVSRRARRNATDAVNDAMDAMGRSLTEHDLTLIVDTFLAALGIIVSDRPGEMT